MIILKIMTVEDNYFGKQWSLRLLFSKLLFSHQRHQWISTYNTNVNKVWRPLRHSGNYESGGVITFMFRWPPPPLLLWKWFPRGVITPRNQGFCRNPRPPPFWSLRPPLEITFITREIPPAGTPPPSGPYDPPLGTHFIKPTQFPYENAMKSSWNTPYDPPWKSLS